MASQGFVRVRLAHSDSLVKQYRRLLGERRFWADRRHHPRATAELARLNAAIDALAKALPLVVPDIALAEMRPLLFHLAVPLPGVALTRAVLAGLRQLYEPTLEKLVAHIAHTYSIDLDLHDVRRLRQRSFRVLGGLTSKGAASMVSEHPPRWRFTARPAPRGLPTSVELAEPATLSFQPQ